jgi:hypothetical protein
MVGRSSFCRNADQLRERLPVPWMQDAYCDLNQKSPFATLSGMNSDTCWESVNTIPIVLWHGIVQK